MRRRLWVASELYYPEETSTGYFLTAIAEGLTGSYEVRAIAGRPGYDKLGTAAAQRERHHCVDIYRLPGVNGGKDRLIRRGLNLIVFAVAAFLFALRHFRRGDLALVVTNPPALPFAIYAAAKLRGAKTVLLVHDVYPDILAATKFLRRATLLYRLLDGVFAGLLRRCDRVVVLGRDMRELLAAKMGDRASRLTVIPNWADVELVTPATRDANPLRAELGLNGKFVVQVSGNIGRTHDLDLILEVAAVLRENEAVRFLLVGQGGKLASIDAAIKARGLANVAVLPRQPRDRLAAMLTCSDLTIIPFVDDMFGLSVPSRMYNIMAAGVPIAAVADARSELALVVTETGCGWVVSPGDDNSLANLINSLATAAATEARRRGDAGRHASEVHHSFDRVITMYAALFSLLTDDFAQS